MATHDGDEVHGSRHVGDRGGFGDLKAEAPGDGVAGFGQRCIHHLQKTPIPNRLTRHIQADPADPRQGSLGGEQRNRFLQNPVIDASDQLKPFSRRQEGPRHHQGTIRLADAQ